MNIFYNEKRHPLRAAAAALALAVLFSGAAPVPVYAVPEAAGEEAAETASAPAVKGAPQKTLRFEEGITVAGVDIGRMTMEQAETALDSHFRQLACSVFTADVNGQKISTAWRNLGLTWEYGPVLEEAIALGKGPGIIGKYKALADMETHGTQLEVPTRITDSAVRKFVSEKLDALSTEPRDASITRENDAFVITPEKLGLDLDVPRTVIAIKEAAAVQIVPEEEAAAVAVVTEPKRTAEQLSQITDMLGTCTSDVAGTDARASNVALGARNINGLVLMPGESASASDLMKPRNKANGYKKAPQYLDGESVDAYGGGVCQVSSTLYNALLRAEIQIDERHPHSMLISYLPASCDAAISAGTKDLKFTNNTDYPIYIEGHSVNRKVTFTVYGKETRPENRKVEYESHITYQSQPADKVIYDPHQPVGYKQTTGGPRHAATNSYLEKVVYVDGVEVSRERLHSDSYRGSSKTVVIGTKQPDPVPAPTPAPAPAP